MGADKDNFDLPDDIFANKKQAVTSDKEPEKKDDFQINFIKIFSSLFSRIMAYIELHERHAGIIISVEAHLLALLIIGFSVAFRPPEECADITVEVTTLELKQIDEIPLEPKPPEKEKNPTEATTTAEEAVSGMDTNVDIGDAEEVDVEEVAITVDIPTMFAAIPNDSALKFPSFFSSRTPAKRKKALKKFGGSDETEKAVEKALAYLASKQNADGSWGSKKLQDGSNVVLSSLALLTFLAHGETTFSKKYGKTVRKGLRRLIKFSKMRNIEKCANGFGHAILAYALSEAYGITRLPAAKEAMDKRVKAIVDGQNKFGSFNENYDNSPQNAAKDAGTGRLKREIIPGEPKCDLSFTGWNCQAMMAAAISGAEVEGLQEALSKTEEGITIVHQAKDGGFSYGFNSKRFEAVPEVTPVGSLCLQLMGAGEKKATKKALKWLEKYKKDRLLQCSWRGNQRFPLYAWYYQTQTLFQGYKGQGRIWKKWNESMKKALVKNQQYDGAWLSPSLGKGEGYGENLLLFSNEDDLSIYCTSFCALMLQVYYRYLPTFIPIENAKKQVCLIDAENEDLGLKITSDFNIKTDEEILSAKPKYVSSFDAVEFGKLNCKPSTPDSKLVKDEFSVYESDENTIRVNKKEDFPQILKSNQRIAIYLDDFIPENFRNHIELKMSIASAIYQDKESKLHILINNNDIWKSRIESRNTMITALIPEDSMEAGGNILQIRNSGVENVSFDYLKLDDFKPGNPIRLAIEDLDKMPYDRRKYFKTGIIDFSCKKEEDEKKAPSKFFLPDAEYALETERLTLFQRRRNLDELKERFKVVALANPEYEKDLARLCKRLERHFKIGIEPIIKVEGENQILLEAASAACGNFVYFWALSKGNKNLVQAIERHSPVSEIINQNLYNIYECDPHKQALPYMASMKKNDFNNLSDSIWGIYSQKDKIGMGLELQTQYLKNEPRYIIEWFWSGGDVLALTNIINGGKFFEELTGKPKLAWKGLIQSEHLFEGSPVKLCSNLVPTGINQYLFDTYYVAVLNKEGVVTIQIATLWPSLKEVELICPIPWSGKTGIRITQGFVPKDYPVKEVEHLKVNEDIVNIENGIFKKKMFLSRLSTIRLVKENVKPPTNLVDLLENEKQKESKYRENKLEVTAKRPAENLIRTQIRWPNGIMSPEGKNYTGQIIPATRERIGHIQNVVPWDAQSSLIEISYPKGKPEGNEGMRLYFGNGPKDVDYLSFWVYPRLDKKARRKITALRFYFNGKFFEADLKTDTWQRVVISLNEKIKPPYWSNICFLADHKRHEFRKGRCASFELNGFATWGKVEKKNGETGLKNVRLATGRDSLSFTFLGKPGSYAEYRYYFKEPVEFKDYIALVNGKNEIVFRGKGWNALKHGIKTMRTIKKKLNITSLMFSRFQPYLNLNETLFKPFLFMVEPYTELPVSKMDLHYNACAQCLELKFHFPETLSEVSSSIARALTRKEKDLIKKKSLVPATLTLNFAKVIPEKNKGKRKK